ncbi:MAG: phospholipase D-like domain-containing protein [Bacteroidetes bacterium]|nr:phospholipase D-like domain-containing protein [Bacteroidota bacterium]
MKKSLLICCFLFYALLSWSQTPKIKCYFSRPVNNAVSNGSNAVYLNQLIDDTLIAYINRARHTIDIAMYSYTETSAISGIASAINNAYSNGVAVRWIYDGSSTNTSLALLDTNIKKLVSPTSALYGIMHNKFMVIDASSTNTTEPIVWTGSTNFTAAQINTDANNVMIIQDAAVAQVYTAEFNEMWGSTGLTPNQTNAKFGPDKTDNTTHLFNVDGTAVEVYFSPTDGANTRLLQAIESAGTDLYFGIYSFTIGTDADSIASRIQNNVYVAGIMDPTSQSYTPYTTLSPIMGTNLIKDNITGLYHNKMLIVDPSAPDSDPMVLTGSFNWSVSADTKNDENLVVIHSASIANQYYQSFYQNFSDEGGTLILQTGINTNPNPLDISIYPVPAKDFITVKSNGIRINGIKGLNYLGQQQFSKTNQQNEKEFTINVSNLSSGIYFMQLQTAKGIVVKKFIVGR